MSKLDKIDLMKLFTHGSANGWNEFLTDCLNELNPNKLMAVRVRIQRGMADLAKQKLNTEEMVNFFCRLDRSIDITLTKIDKKLNPMLNDNPLAAEKNGEHLKKKRARDAEREAYRKKSSY